MFLYIHTYRDSYETARFGQITTSSETHSILLIPDSFPNYRRNNFQSSILKCTRKRSVNKIFLFKNSLNIVAQIGNVASTQPLEICRRTSDVTAKPCTQQKVQ